MVKCILIMQQWLWEVVLGYWLKIKLSHCTEAKAEGRQEDNGAGILGARWGERVPGICYSTGREILKKRQKSTGVEMEDTLGMKKMQSKQREKRFFWKIWRMIKEKMARVMKWKNKEVQIKTGGERMETKRRRIKRGKQPLEDRGTSLCVLSPS